MVQTTLKLWRRQCEVSAVGPKWHSHCFSCLLDLWYHKPSARARQWGFGVCPQQSVMIFEPNDHRVCRVRWKDGEGTLPGTFDASAQSSFGKSSSEPNPLCQHTSLWDLQGLQTLQGCFLQHFHFSRLGTSQKKEGFLPHRQTFPFVLQGCGGGIRFPLLVFPHPSPLSPPQHFLPLHGDSTQTISLLSGLMQSCHKYAVQMQRVTHAGDSSGDGDGASVGPVSQQGWLAAQLTPTACGNTSQSGFCGSPASPAWVALMALSGGSWTSGQEKLQWVLLALLAGERGFG